MPKSKIIKDLANGTVDIETSLNRLFLLASDIGDSRIMTWVENELQGYSSDEKLPEYRIQKSYMLRYSGLNGNYQVHNVTLQPELFPPEKLNKITVIRVYQSIKAILEASIKNEDMVRDYGWLARDVYDYSEGQIEAIRISQVVPASMFQDILSAIKQKAIRELIELENKYGNLDSLEIQSDDDPENIVFWNNINDRIKAKAKKLYMQDFFEASAKTAVIEVETRLRELFRELRPGSAEPRDIGAIISALLSENGAYKYCDLSTQDGKNFCKGYVDLTRGFFEAYRNPLSHKNREMTKREAFELISLSSMIMEVLNQGEDSQTQN